MLHLNIKTEIGRNGGQRPEETQNPGLVTKGCGEEDTHKNAKPWFLLRFHTAEFGTNGWRFRTQLSVHDWEDACAWYLWLFPVVFGGCCEGAVGVFVLGRGPFASEGFWRRISEGGVHGGQFWRGWPRWGFVQNSVLEGPSASFCSCVAKPFEPNSDTVQVHPPFGIVGTSGGSGRSAWQFLFVRSVLGSNFWLAQNTLHVDFLVGTTLVHIPVRLSHLHVQRIYLHTHICICFVYGYGFALNFTGCCKHVQTRIVK